MSTPCNDFRWFALRVKSGFEQRVASIACNRGFEVFLPSYQCRRRWSDRYQSVDAPLFPGYLFCRLDPERRLPLLTIPKVMHLVGIGRRPEPLDPSEIEAIRKVILSNVHAEPWPFLQVGQRVHVEEGPLAGVEGILIQIRKQHRLVLSVTLLMRSVVTEIAREWIRPLNHARPALQGQPMHLSTRGVHN